MKVALIYPRGNELPKQFDGIIETRPRECLPPLGMLYIRYNSPADVYFFDNRILDFYDNELANILKRYEVVAFGGTLFEAEQAVAVSRILKGKVFTVYGGANATVNYKDYLNDFDQIVIGEADTYDFKSRDKIVRLPRNKNLDSLKFPKRYSNYNRHEKWLEFPTDTVVSSRGCPYDCSFCSSKIIWNKKYTIRSAENVLEEVNYLARNYGTKSIYFREDNFTVNKGRLHKLCNSMPLEWKCESRVDAINDVTARIMSNGGCKIIWMGIEHTDDCILNTVSKGTTYERTVEAIEACDKYGIKTVGSFIVGLPEETLFDIFKNAIKIAGLNLDHVSLNRAYAFSKSEMYQEIIDNGLDSFNHNGIILPRTKHVSRKTVDCVYYFVKKYFALYEKYVK